MAKQVVAMLAALLLLVSMAGYPVGLVGTASASHAGGTIIVDANNGPGTDNTTIQGAINHADPGDEIYVRAGTYTEAVVVNKSVTIFTNRSVVMDGRGLDGPAFNLTNTTSGSSLDDVIITGFPAIENYSTGIAVSNAGGVSNVIIENNTVENVSDTGIRLSYSSGTYTNVTLANNTVNSPQRINASIAIVTAGGATGNDTVLLRNEFNESSTAVGILVRTQGTSSFENTTIFENNASVADVGLYLDLRDTSTIADLNVSRNGFAKATDAGLRIEANAAGTDAALTDVNLFENALNNSAGVGVNVSASETLNVNNLTLLRNVISNNTRGIDVNLSGTSTWEAITVAGNALNDSTGATAAIGVRLRTHQQASVTDLNLTANVIGNGDKGLYVVERGTSSLDNLTVDSNSFQGNDEHGVVIWAQGDATATDIEITSNAINGTAGATGLTVPSAGVALLSSVDGAITDVSLSENNMSDNPIGLQVGAAHRSEVSGVNLSTNLMSRSSTQGVFLLAGLVSGGAPNDGTIADVTIDSNALNGSSDGIGVHVESWGTSNVSNVQVTGNNVSNNSVGVLARPGNSSTIEGLNVSSNLLSDSGESAVALGAGTTPASTATLRNVTVEANALNETVVGLNVEGQGSATVTEVNVTENDLRNNDVGVQVKPAGQSTVSALNVTNNLLNGSTAGTFSSVVIEPLDSATVDDVHLFQNALNDNAATDLPAVVINATGSATASNVLVEENALNDNDVGLYLTADETGTVTGVDVTTNLLNGSTNGAIAIEASGSGTVSAVDVSTNGLNDTAANGLDIATADDATVGPLNVTENSFANTSVGVHADVGGNSTLTGLNVTNNLLNGSSLHGIKLVADGSVARITDVHVFENLLNDTATQPLVVGAAGEANVSGVLVQTNDLSNNTVGAQFYAHNDSTIHGLNVTNNFIEGSSEIGVYLQVRSDAGATSTVQGVDLLENALNETDQGPGVQIDAFDASAVSDVRVETNDLRNNVVGLLVNAPEDATVTGLTVTEALASGSDQGALRLIAGTHGTTNAATISGVDVRDAGLNDSVNGAGLQVQAFGSSRVADLSLDTADVSNNTVGLVLNATGSATIENVSLQSALFSENDVAAGVIQSGQANTGSAAAVTNVSVTEVGLNDTASGPGLLVATFDSSTVTDVSFDTVSFENNTRGLFVSASNGSTVDGIDVSSALFSDNDVNGALLFTGAVGSGSSSTIANVSFESVGLNETAGTGLAVLATGTSTVTGLDIDTASLADNTDWGLTLQALESGTVRDVSAETALFSGNANGTAAVAGSLGGSDTATVTNVSFTEVGLNETAGTGLLLGAQADSTLSDVSLQTTELSDNDIGLQAVVRDSASLSNLSVNEALVNASTEHGVLLNASGTASLSEVEFDTMGVNFTATGAGLEVRSGDSATVTNVTLFQVLTKENPVGQRYVAHDGSTITGLNVTNTLNENNDRSGLAIEAGAPTGTHSATVSDVDVRVNAFNDTASGAGVNVSAWDGATVTGVTLFQNAIDGNQHGLRVAARDGGTLDDVNVTQALIQDSTQNGLFVDGDATGNYAAVKVRLSLIQDSAGAGVYVSPNAAVSGITVHRAFISGNAIGVDNDADATFDARFNWWGHSSGAGSVADADAPFEDPDTGKLASGEGDTVSESPSTAGVSNVRFDPSIGGKTRADDDPQLIDPVAQLTDQNFSITVAGQTIEGPVSDFVGLAVWERAGLPFRADDATAATKVQNTRIDLRTSDGDIRIAGEGSNRKFIKVFNHGDQLTLDYVKLSPGADTTRFAGDDVKLVAVRLNQSANVSTNLEDLFTTDIDTETGEATLATNATKVEVFDLGSLDGNGELRDIPYTPTEPGSYALFMTRVDSGDGLQVTNSGNLTFNVLNDSTTVTGAEVITVHETASTAAPRTSVARPGDTIVFDATSNLNSANVTHAVVLYDKKEFEEGLTVINASNTTIEINGSIITATITGSNAGQPFLVSINATTGGTVNNVSTDGALGNTTGAIGITRFGASTDTVLVDVPTNVVFGSEKNKTFNWVHLAVAEGNTTKRSTTDAQGDVIHVTVTDAPSIQVSPTTLNFDGVQLGSSRTLDVNVSNTGNVTLNITSTAIVGTDPGPFSIVSGGGQDLLAPGANKTISVRFSPTAPGPKNANLRIRSNDTVNPTFDVTLRGSGPSGAGGGGGQAGTATPTPTPTATPTPPTTTAPPPTTTVPTTTAPPPTTTTVPTTTAPPPTTPGQPFPLGIAIGILIVLAILGGLAYVYREAILALLRGE